MFYSFTFGSHSWLKWVCVKCWVLIFCFIQNCVDLFIFAYLSWILFYFSSFTCIKIPYLFRKSVEFKICSTCINDFIQNVLYWMLLLLEVEQDSKDVYKKLQCQQKIYISRKSSKSRRHLLHSYIFSFLIMCHFNEHTNSISLYDNHTVTFTSYTYLIDLIYFLSFL